MEDLNVQILQAFHVKVKRIVKEKSYYICGTDKGCKVVRKSLESGTRIQFEHEVKERLYQTGFPNTDRFTLSAEGLPYVECDGGFYVMTDAFSEAAEADFGNNERFQQIVASVADFHRLARDIPFTAEPPVCAEEPLGNYRRQIALMDSVKKRLGGARRLSDFDVLFLKNHAHYTEQMRSSVEMLAKTPLVEKRAFAKRHATICHNLLKEEYVLTDGTQTYITGFSQAAVDYQIFDLCGILTRYAKNLPAEPYSVGALLELYDKHNPLDQTDLDILYPLLKYPGKFVKICGQYYSKNRTWTPNAIGNRIESVLNGRRQFEEWLEN